VPAEDRRSMIAAEIMAAIYFALLQTKSKQTQFRVYRIECMN
jgi:hypothetical protein